MHGPVLDGAQQSDCTAVSRRYSQCSTAEGWAHVQHGPGGLCMGWELLSQWGQVAGTARTWWLGHETDACLLFDPENKLQLQCSLWGTNISLASLVNLLSLRVHTWWNYLSCNEYQFKLLMLTSACPNAWLFPVSKSISLQHQGPKCSQPGSRVLAPPPPRNENKIDIICFVIVPLGLNQKWHKTTDGCKYTGETEDKTFIHLVSISHGAPAAQVLNIL